MNRTQQEAQISEVHRALLFTDVFAHTHSSLMGHVAGNGTQPIAKPGSSLTGLQKANGLLPQY